MTEPVLANKEMINVWYIMYGWLHIYLAGVIVYIIYEYVITEYYCNNKRGCMFTVCIHGNE